MYRCPSPLNGGANNYVLICSVTDPECETIADCNLCVPSPVLLLDEVVGAEGLLVGLALERVTGRHLVGSHSEARKALKCYLA